MKPEEESQQLEQQELRVQVEEQALEGVWARLLRQERLVRGLDQVTKRIVVNAVAVSVGRGPKTEKMMDGADDEARLEDERVVKLADQ